MTIQEGTENIYQLRASQFTAEDTALRRKYDRYSLVRLVVFFAGLGLAVLFFSWHWAVAVVFFLLFLAGFYRLMQWHRRIQEAAEHAGRLAAINLAEARALAHRFDKFPNGARFSQPDHPNALDLDLFGEHSIFQYCCRATTAIGQERLAQFLLEPAPVPEILERQQAIAELRPMLDWRQNFQAHGLETTDDPRHLHLLHGWLRDGDLVLGNRWLTLAVWVAPWWFLACFVAWVSVITWPVFVLLLVPVLVVLKKTNERVGQIHLRTAFAGETLAAYARLVRHLENQDFQAPLNARLRSKLTGNGLPASMHVRRLSYIIRQLNMRFNFFSIFLNIIGLWDLHYVLKLEKWRTAMKDGLPEWFESLREFEALSSLANGWFNNPDWCLPTFHEQPRFEAGNLGHPLIHHAKRRGNDFSMDTRGHIKLITGSNMAGKSTFLRTVGLNIVLAQAGAPVCSEKMALSPMRVFTSMRTQDDLSESTSSFYAELKRLKTIIEAVKWAGSRSEDLPVFFLLDEILKGTNSVDRHTGSAALIRQLIRLQGGGLIATHDLELGRMEAESGGTVENLCMEVEIRDGQLFFDYQLKKGVSKSFNATLLMRQMGIEV
ncbi:MAG: DNA mismatch repair protein MutS [Bacteroidetes bacterium]|nr:DNA mismatch repair protein MutS [Bacteroidota bacterium]